MRAYKRLVERAFRSLKTVDLKVRPVFHRTADRVRAHVLLCMLAYYVEWHMRARLKPLLFASIVAPAQISDAGKSPRQTHRERTSGAQLPHPARRSGDDHQEPGCRPAPCRSKSSPGPPRYSALFMRLGVRLERSRIPSIFLIIH